MVQSDNGSDLLSVSQLASYLGIAERTIFLWAQQNKLPAFKLGSMWRFRRSDIDQWLETQRSGPPVSHASSAITDPIAPPPTRKQLNEDEQIAEAALLEACVSFIHSIMQEETDRTVWAFNWFVERYNLAERFGDECIETALKRLAKNKELAIKYTKDEYGRKVKTLHRR